MNILTLTGGIGGAKLALGLSHVLGPDQVTFAVNVGDDFEHLGLHISPDIDTLTYTLAGEVNPKTGWGRSDESWQAMTALDSLGGETWFQLGDRDLGLHLFRTDLLKQGMSLSEVTDLIRRQLGVQHPVVPITDDVLRTVVNTERGTLDFQEYFVKHRCQPRVTSVEYRQPQPASLSPRIQFENFDGILICPSNPYLSIDPLLAVQELDQYLRNRTVPVIAVSPIVGSDSIKGPTAKMMQELGVPTSCTTIAEYYRDFIDGFVIDVVDEEHVACITKLGIQVAVRPSVMSTLEDKIQLATDCISFFESMGVCS